MQSDGVLASVLFRLVAELNISEDIVESNLVRMLTTQGVQVLSDDVLDPWELLNRVVELLSMHHVKGRLGRATSLHVQVVVDKEGIRIDARAFAEQLNHQVGAIIHLRQDLNSACSDNEHSLADIVYVVQD